MTNKHTPGPWEVRKRERDGEIIDCFVTAQDVNGFAYDAEILGDDEYREDIERKLADCYLISAAPELLAALEKLLNALPSATTHPAIKTARAAIAKATGSAS